MNRFLLFFAALFLYYFSFGQCADLFFSEYLEGSSNNKAFEIFNPTPYDIDLSDYVVYRNNNGSLTPTDSLFPMGIVASGNVFVIANPSANPSILVESDTTHTLTFYNGDDALWLKRISSGDTLDIIGEIGEDPGTSWPVGAGATANFTLIRMATINGGQTNWSIGATEWDVFSIDMADSLGAHIMSPIIAFIDVVACDSLVSPSGDYVWTETGSYMDFITSVSGCDSSIHVNLTVVHSSDSSLAITACNNYTSPSGDYLWTETGIYTDTIANAAGCDSIITIDLTILNATGSFLTTAACDSYTSPSGNYTWTTSGIHHDTIPNHLGCDSIIVVNLTIKHSSTFYFETTICDSYTSPSGDYTWTTSGLYYDTIPNHVGCDSIILIDLTVLHSSEVSLFTSACKFYVSPSGHVWTSGGTYTDTLTNMVGCDSIITINLTIYNVDVTVTQDENELKANNAGAFYQWLDCNDGYAEITGENNQLFIATENGSYAVEIFQDGCTDTSACYTIGGLGIGENQTEKTISIYPNPTQGDFYINLNEDYHQITVTAYDFTGKIVQTEQFTNENTIPFHLAGRAGVYMIEIAADDLPPKRMHIRKY